MQKVEGLPGPDKAERILKFKIATFRNLASDTRLNRQARAFYSAVARELEKVLREISDEG